ncbi:MAG: tail fiber domain-containing protein [Chthoniobacterales bacterium]|nr:tail fiber domain-containing protein [Chthoniobacterales bacterium]
MASLLGIPGSTVGAVGNAANGVATAGGANPGYSQYLQNAGYAPAMRQLSQSVTGQGAAAGLLNSGTTARALQSRGADLNQGFFNNYLQNVNTVAGNGLQAGGLIANTGQKSTSTGGSPSTVGSIASTVGGIASIFSDRRLKTAIRKVGEFADGLGIYTYRYVGQKNRLRGVMADEVAKMRPWALGRTVAGYMTVNYGAL